MYLFNECPTKFSSYIHIYVASQVRLSFPPPPTPLVCVRRHRFSQGVKEPLRRYAQTLVKVDPGVRTVLGMETGAREAPAKK